MDAEKITTNTPKAYIHFERATQVAFFHNSREAFLPQTSYEELRGKNICDRTAAEARALFQKLDEQADAAFLAKAGRRTNMKEGNKIWEYVCLLKEENTWEDVERLMRRVEQETGYTTLQASLHEDEGHFDENGVFKKNRHIQVDVFTRSLEDGRSLCLENYGRKDLMKKLQKIVSEELGLEEGEPKEITKRKHIPHRKYRAMKEAEKQAEYEQKLEKNNAEWQAKMAEKQAEWEQKKAEWEAKQAEREAKREEWEKKLPEIMEARRRNEQFLNGKVDWETLKTANKAFLLWHDISTDLLGYPNPHGNLIIEQAKGSLASIFRLFGSVSQLAIFLLTRTEARELKLKNTMDVYKVSENLQRAVNLVANDTTNDHRKIAEKIQSVFTNLPHDKRQELIELAILHAPNSEIREDIKALIEGRFSDIAKSEQAQRRIENRDLRAELRIFGEEARKIKEELKALDEENRILNLAERAILREKGAGREQYADQEAENRERVDELKRLKDEVKDLKKTTDDQKKQSEIDAKTIADLNDKIAELNEQISKITAENAKKQRELEQELEAEKAARKTAEIITPQMLDSALKQIDELEADKAARKTAETLDAFGIIDDLEQKLKPREEPKIEPKPEPEPIAKKADDNLNIYGYPRPNVEPRRRLDEYPRERKIDDRPKYEPEPVKQPEKIEPISEEPIFRDPWTKIENDLERWKKADSEVDKKMLSLQILRDIEKYEKSGWGIPFHRQLTLDSFRRAANYDPVADELEAQKNAETIRKVAAIHRELDQKRQAAELELEKKYDDVKKNVKQDTDAKQTALKKKKKDELEMGMG